MELTKEQIKELEELLLKYDQPILTADILETFIKKYKISLRSIIRRDTQKKFKTGYSFNEYSTNIKLQSNYNKNNIFIRCQCGKKYVTILFGFHKRKYKEPLCDLCYRKTYMYDSVWRKNNSDSQKIAQNRPETLLKQHLSQKKRFQNFDVIEKYRSNGKKLWESIDYRKKCLANKKLLTGVYKGVSYGSSLELSFLLWCEENNITNVKNFNINGIKYTFDKQRTYYPDFIINNQTIIEIKGTGHTYQKTFDKTQKKFEALETWCKENNFKFRIIFDNDIENRLRNKAKKIHHENNKKKLQTI